MKPSKTAKFTSIKNCTELLLMEYMRQSQIFNKPLHFHLFCVYGYFNIVTKNDKTRNISGPTKHPQAFPLMNAMYDSCKKMPVTE